MRHPLLSALVLVTLLIESTFALAATPSQRFLRIASAGGVYKLAGKVDLPATAGTYRLVIDAGTDETTATGINRHLESAARALNLYALAGVSNESVKVAVVLHGNATRVALASDVYRRKYGRSNRDSVLIDDLKNAGVDIYVCGQALTQQGFEVSDVHKKVDVSLSAMTTLVDLQGKNYALIP